MNEKDDAVAVILARLGRPEDYERLLWKKNEELRVNRSPLNLGMSLGSVPLLDNTRALPEPGQVVDVNRYIDIQLAVVRRLRQEAVVGPEFELAQICMLGQWCAGRDLATRAMALLEQAEKLGTGMLTGRLWVADLQRILGKDPAAVEIELGLLGHDMLPLDRVPAALDAIDGRKGKPAADAVAYRLADYTNDFAGADPGRFAMPRRMRCGRNTSISPNACARWEPSSCRPPRHAPSRAMPPSRTGPPRSPPQRPNYQTPRNQGRSWPWPMTTIPPSHA